MKRLLIAASALSMLAGMGSAGVAAAQPGPGYYDHRDHYDRRDDRGYDRRDDRRYDDRRWDRRDDRGAYYRHRDWRRGGRIDYDDWRRGQIVDYRRYHLRRPPYGYQWRYVDGNYVLAAIAGGIIADLIAR